MGGEVLCPVHCPNLLPVHPEKLINYHHETNHENWLVMDMTAMIIKHCSMIFDLSVPLLLSLNLINSSRSKCLKNIKSVVLHMKWESKCYMKRRHVNIMICAGYLCPDKKKMD